ncbi:MAG: hypothetical protein M1144_03810 [Candidatus Thermoplasmatota archaeon]|jgi:tetratricopeptide (TPR) repeat protein|nr:hypothetical protein [Candidatus Thermoplasmatota archaeon]
MTMTKLVESITTSFGQKLTEAKWANNITFLSTPDSFLYTLVEDPKDVNPADLVAVVKNGLKNFKHVVILSQHPLTPEFTQGLPESKISLVQGERFEQLLRALDLQSIPEVKPKTDEMRSVLPTAEKLDKLMRLGREWADYGVPALATRFFNEAARLKPEYVPALLGLGEAYLALGLLEPAQTSFDRVLELQEGNVSARLGRARLHGLHGRVRKEILELETLLRETPGSVAVRAHLLAALVEARSWPDAVTHVDELIRLAPSEGRFHAMKAALLHHLGEVLLAKKEERVTLSLGVSGDDLQRVYDTMHLELPKPAKPAKPAPSPKASKPARAARKH